MFYQTDRDTWRNYGTLSKLKELNTIDREEGKDKKRQEGYIYMCVRVLQEGKRMGQNKNVVLRNLRQVFFITNESPCHDSLFNILNFLSHFHDIIQKDS